MRTTKIKPKPSCFMFSQSSWADLGVATQAQAPNIFPKALGLKKHNTKEKKKSRQYVQGAVLKSAKEAVVSGM